MSIQSFYFHDLANMQFARGTLRMFLYTNIPLHKLTHPAFRAYLSKYTGREPPSVTSSRNHQEQIYLWAIEKIRRSIESNYILVLLDETTDNYICYIVLTVVGNMFATAPRIPHFNLNVVKNSNNETVMAAFNKLMALLHLQGVQYEKKFSLVYDAAPCMRLANGCLKIGCYYKHLHITCLAHEFKGSACLSKRWTKR